MSEWKKVKLGDISKILSGYAFDSTLFTTDINYMPLIRIRDVVRGNTETYYKGNYDEKYIISCGDFLIGMDGEFNLGQWKSEDALLNQRVCKIICNSNKVFDKYIFCYLPIALKEIENKTSFVTVKHLSVKSINEIIVPIPDMYLQTKIANIFDKTKKLIDYRKKQIEELDNLIQSIFYVMFGDPISNSMNWKYEILSNIGDLGRGVSKNRPRNSSELLGGIHPLIQTGDISNAGLFINSYNSTYSDLGLQQSKKWGKGTLCITIAANIAKTAILSFDACFPDSVVGFISNQNTNNIYMHYWFGFFQKIIEDQAPESAQKNINLKILNELEVICPPIELQNKFADFVLKVEQKKSILQQSLNQMELNYKSLMQRAFNGTLFN